MKVTLTGSTGFIGSHILTELQEHGHEVTAPGTAPRLPAPDEPMNRHEEERAPE